MAGQVTTLFSDSAKTNELYPRTKTSAVSDANGNTLGDLAVYNAVTVGTGVNPVEVGWNISDEPLWENNSPTTNYGADTASFNSTGYQALYLIYRSATGSPFNTYHVPMIIYQQDMIYSCTSQIGSRLRLRYATWTVNGVVFTECEKWDTYASGSTKDNSCLVPYQIWGIK